ncbi:hypothetical protein RUM43_009234 [Polyplax serrata]|uniref:Uncharacterized protein n=1 Tax=Polyplax serrata TaxID=468196 RepID=A0AAN8NVQ9_POLSC
MGRYKVQQTIKDLKQCRRQEKRGREGLSRCESDKGEGGVHQMDEAPNDNLKRVDPTDGSHYLKIRFFWRR